MELGNSFIAIDFETANAKRVSACSLGVAKIVDGVISEHHTYLIKPVGGFSPFNIKIHGITPDKTADAPTFDKLFPLLRNEFESFPVLCYSAFDRSVFDALSGYYGLELSHDVVFFDVCEYAHNCLQGLPNYKLPTVSKALHLQDFQHHDAEADALQCAQVYLALMSEGENKKYQEKCRCAIKADNVSWQDTFILFASHIVAKGSIDLEEAYELLMCLDAVAGRNKLLRSIADMADVVLEDGVVTQKESALLCAMLEYAIDSVANESVKDSSTSAAQLEIPICDTSGDICIYEPPPMPELEIPERYLPVMKDIPENYKARWDYVKEHPFTTFASSIVSITGNGNRIGRLCAERKLLDLGATLKNSVPTRNTDFCVVLGQSPNDCSSSKAVRARELQDKGSPIRILDEDEFIEMLKASIAESANDCKNCA